MIDFIQFIIKYWWLALLLFGAGAGLGIRFYIFMHLPIQEKKKRIGAFLLSLMVRAENEFQTAKGQARFKVVIGWFYEKCPLWMKDIFTEEDLEKFAESIFAKNKVDIETANDIKQAKLQADNITFED